MEWRTRYISSLQIHRVRSENFDVITLTIPRAVLVEAPETIYNICGMSASAMKLPMCFKNRLYEQKPPHFRGNYG
jgi:hypothetical protein